MCATRKCQHVLFKVCKTVAMSDSIVKGGHSSCFPCYVDDTVFVRVSLDAGNVLKVMFSLKLSSIFSF